MLNYLRVIIVRFKKVKIFAIKYVEWPKLECVRGVAIGNDLLNGIDIKEDMEYADGIKNTKVAVVEIVPGEGAHL